MRLVLHLSPSSIEFTEQNSGGPYPYLLTVGKRREVAHAGTPIGIASTEAPNVAVTLDNSRGKVTAIAARPLRVAADTYDDDDVLTFSGTVSSIELADVVTWEIDA